MKTAMTVICYGDSNTYGYDPRSFFGGRYDAQNRWVDILRAKTGWDVVNEGENGREVPRFPVTFPGASAVIVMLGINDLLQGRTPELTAKRMETFLLGMDLPMERIVLVAPPIPTRGEWVPDEVIMDDTRKLGRLYEALSQRLGTAFVNAAEWDIPMAYDGVHFTEEGHRRFAERLCAYFMRMEQI